MTEYPGDYAWTKRLRRFTEVSRLTEAKCWQLAGDSDCYDMYQWLDLAEETILTAAQREELKTYIWGDSDV